MTLAIFKRAQVYQVLRDQGIEYVLREVIMAIRVQAYRKAEVTDYVAERAINDEARLVEVALKAILKARRERSNT